MHGGQGCQRNRNFAATGSPQSAAKGQTLARREPIRPQLRRERFPSGHSSTSSCRLLCPHPGAKKTRLMPLHQAGAKSAEPVAKVSGRTDASQRLGRSQARVAAHNFGSTGTGQLADTGPRELPPTANGRSDTGRPFFFAILLATLTFIARR
jgi:hypothetical protein